MPQDGRLPISHLLFTTSSHCMACHNQVRTPGGEDISIGAQWRASIMANSSRDPYWQASIRRETMDHPTLTAAIEDKCSTCHMPMQRFQAHAEGGEGKVLQYLRAISSGQAQKEPDGVLERAKDRKAALAADGVSCTVCHQILPDNLHEESSLDGGFLIDTTRKPEHRLVYGPFDQPDAGRVRIMNSSTSFVPTRGDQTRDAALCASCHTLFTNAVDDKGKPAGVLPEQVPYQEWQHSDFAGQRTCQSCHMPKVEGEAPFASVHAKLHEGVSRHVFVGGNAFLLQILAGHGGELGAAAPAADLEASAKRSEALLGEQTAKVEIQNSRYAGGQLDFDVKVDNLAGHKLPTAYPARRAWLHVTVRDGSGAVVFESGAPRPDGSIAGNDNDADPLKFEPHYSRITAPDQVQIYESIMGDYAGRPTTGLLYGTHYLKDNRILPQGFDKRTADSRIAVVGPAKADPRFVGGSDTVTYSLALPAGRYTAQAELLYESISYRWAHNLAGYDAPEPKRFLGYFDQYASTAPKRLAGARSELR
jgi:hypothetical protein